MNPTVSFLALFFVSGAMAAPYASTEEWLKVGKPRRDHEVRLTFAIKQTNTKWLKETLKAVSYPVSPQYGQYLNFDEISQFVHGRPESVKAVMETLSSGGVETSRIDFTIGKDFAVVLLPVEKAEEIFLADFYEFRHSRQGKWTVIRSLNFTLPALLEGHLDFVFGITEFPRKPKILSGKGGYRRRDSGSLSADPESIAKAYNTSGYVSTSPDNSQAIAGFLKQYFNPKDLEKFQEKYSLPVRPITKIVGGNSPDDAGAEAELDVQYISATGRNVSTWFISISTLANHGQEDFLSWIVSQVNTTDSPWVHSASYGDIESSIDSSYLSRCENEFMKFGVSGRTIVFASGDRGADCSGFERKFTPMWPASSPYITTVGGTTSLTSVWRDGGGGFSNFFSTPDYQSSTVQAYLKSGKAPPTRHFNTSGRAYPDVSVFSVDFVIEYDGIPFPVDGTSCAAPTFAGIMSILNDVRLKRGQKTLGFLNPLLYQTLHGNGFIDITEGSNGGGLLCPGFDAIQGWDPASGWGSPNFGLLAHLV